MKAGSQQGRADESGAQELSFWDSRLLRLGHLAHSSPNCTLYSPDEVSSLSSLLVMPVTTQSAERFLLGDGLYPAPHFPDPDPRTESIAALTRPSPLPLKGSSGFHGIQVQVILTSAPSETLRSQRKVFACLPFYRHISGRLYPSSHSPGPAWNTLPQAAHSKQPRFPGV